MRESQLFEYDLKPRQSHVKAGKACTLIRCIINISVARSFYKVRDMLFAASISEKKTLMEYGLKS
jgi:hypothetical protein